MSDHNHEGPMDENSDPIMPADGSRTQHTVSESADKIVVKTKTTRGNGTRDQDKIDLKVKGDDPAEVVDKLNGTLARLEDTSETLRSMQPGEDK